MVSQINTHILLTDSMNVNEQNQLELGKVINVIDHSTMNLNKVYLVTDIAIPYVENDIDILKNYKVTILIIADTGEFRKYRVLGECDLKEMTELETEHGLYRKYLLQNISTKALFDEKGMYTILSILSHREFDLDDYLTEIVTDENSTTNTINERLYEILNKQHVIVTEGEPSAIH